MDALALSATLVLVRVTAFVAALPLFGTAQTPRLVKLGLALALTVFHLGCMSLPPPALASVDRAWPAVALLVTREAVLGAVWGYLFGFVLMPVRIAGEFVNQGLGLSFGNIVSGGGEVVTSPVSQIFETIGVLLFLGVDGHHVFFHVLAESFAALPVGARPPDIPVVRLVGTLQAAVEYGLVLGAPVALCLFLNTVVLSLLTRAAPQLNIYSVGFSVQLGVGLLATLLLLPNLVPAFALALDRMKDLVLRALG